jgi:hypothetical protein
MASTHSIANIGDKLIVGAVDTSFLTASSRIFPGTAVLNGPVFIGATPQIGVARATCMIGPPLSIAAPASLEVNGISNFIGVNNIFGTEFIFGAILIEGTKTTFGVEITDGTEIVNGTQTINGLQVVNGLSQVNGIVNADEVFNSFTSLGQTFAIAVSKKSFDIKHPSKENHRLRYICLEGPSAEVYIRGKLINESDIILPDYWKDFIYIESIGVDITPIGYPQDLYVEPEIDGERIKVRSNTDKPIKCYYTVFAERKDTSKNISEYRGLTPADYPGDNDEYSINSF